EDALALALEEAGLAHDAFGAVDREGLLAPELELRPDYRIVHDIGQLVSRTQFEDVDRTHVAAVGAARALGDVDIDLDHRGPLRRLERGGLLGFRGRGSGFLRCVTRMPSATELPLADERIHREVPGPSHLFPDRFGDLDAPVVGLIVLEDRDHETGERDPRGVEGVQRLGTGRLVAAPADIRANRLIRLEVRDGAHLEPALSAGRPELQVVALRGLLREVARAQAHGTER